MTALSLLPLSKSLGKVDSSVTGHSTKTDFNGAQPSWDASPPKSTASSRRSSARSTTRRSSDVGQTVRAVVRNKIAERKGNSVSTSQHRGQASASGSNHSVTNRSAPSINLSPKRSPHQSRTVSSSSSNNGGRSSNPLESPPKKGRRPGSVSNFLKTTHRQLKADIAKIQDKIIFL